jgi:hypothetical protein
MRTNDWYIVAGGVLIVLAVTVLTGFLVARLSATTPAVIAAILTAFAGVLAAIPPIIKALRGR